MLNVVPIQINSAMRNVVINHPNSLGVQVYRKVFTRVSGSDLMGLPTIGGLGVISSEDESDYDFVHAGNAYALQVENFNPSLMMDQQDANNGSEDNFYFLIEPEELFPHPESFEVKKNDIMLVVINIIEGSEIKIAFEVVGIETTTNIAPFTQRYICNRRQHLDISI